MHGALVQLGPSCADIFDALKRTDLSPDGGACGGGETRHGGTWTRHMVQRASELCLGATAQRASNANCLPVAVTVTAVAAKLPITQAAEVLSHLSLLFWPAVKAETRFLLSRAEKRALDQDAPLPTSPSSGGGVSITHLRFTPLVRPLFHLSPSSLAAVLSSRFGFALFPPPRSLVRSWLTCLGGGALECSSLIFSIPNPPSDSEPPA